VIRIFGSLSVVAIILMIAVLLIGLMGGDYNGAWRELQNARRQAESLSLPLQGQPSTDEQRSAQQNVEMAHARFIATRSSSRLHMLLGLAAVLLTVFVNSLSITYFVGTGRWCKEVSETYRLGAAWVTRSAAIKRKSFPWAMLGMVWIGAVAGFGAASDPGNLMDHTQSWVPWHQILALAAPAVLAYAFFRQWACIDANQELLRQIMHEVSMARQQRGLTTTA
jgi:hypothetical protein